MPIPEHANCLVTGATGFLGTELVRTLVGAGVSPGRLRCLVRDPDRAARRGLPRASLCAGDVMDPASLRRALPDVGFVFHLAGTLKAARARDYFEVNRDGAGNLAAAVAAVAPQAFVIAVSSLAAAGPSVDGKGSDLPPERCHTVSAYGESKRQGELAIRMGVQHCAIVRPPIVYGPGDAATRLLFAQARAPLCLVPPRARPLSIVHVRDVATALLAVAARQPRGAVLPLEGRERTDTHALLRAIAAACGRRARLLPVPLGMAAVAAAVCDLGAALTGRAGFFNADKVRELAATGWVADAARARDVLAWSPRVELAAGLREVAVAEGFVAAGDAAAT